MLSAAEKQAYLNDGYLVIKNFVTENMCKLLIERAQKLIEDFAEEDKKIIFSTSDQQHAKSQYFLDSGDKIRFFFEEGAINAQGKLTTAKSFAINKIGHALHDFDPVFNCFSRSYKLARLAEELGIIEALLLQSMVICKQPYIGSEVEPHQDATYLFVKDHAVTGFWFALEDATLENGCLWAIPGGHKTQLKSRLLRDKENKISFEVYDDTPWDINTMQPLEVPCGSLIVLHGLLPHMSKENISAKSRFAYSLHIASALHEYPSNNWLQRSAQFPFQGFLI